MSMTLQEMRDFVRTHADADVTDAPDSSLEVYGRIAYNDIISRLSWPHLTVVYSLSTVAGQSEYTISGIVPGDLDQVSSIVDTTNLGRRLIYMSQSDADLAFGAPIGATSEVANAFTVVDTSLFLYPTPGVTGKLYQVRGRRRPAQWPTTAGSVPDLPDTLHTAIAWYMLSSYFLSQEDPQMAGVYLNEYEQMVRRHTQEEGSREFSGRPLVMGGQNYYAPNFTRFVRGMLE
jgi:hypothetical protein